MDPVWFKRPRPIELLMLIVSIALVASLFVPRVVSRSGSQMPSGRVELKAIQVRLENYRIAHQAYPATLEAVRGVNPVDPWGNPYRYLPTGLKYELWSAGPDGVDGTDDDLR